MTARKAANGRSTIYQEGDGSWRGEVSFGVDAGGKRIRRKVRGQTQAVVTKKVRALEGERDAGVRRTKARTVESWLEEWIAGRSLAARPTTMRGYRADVPHIVRTLGRVRIEQLTPEQVEAMYRDCLAYPVSAGTVMHIRRTLSAAMNTAKERRYILDNPVKVATCPEYELPDVDPYDETLARRIVAASFEARNGARWLTQLSLGMRQGEVLGLEWDADLDLEGGWIDISHQLQPRAVEHGCPTKAPCGRSEARSCPQRKGGGLHRVKVKSKASNRRLKLPDELVVLLRRTRLNQKQERLRAGSKWVAGDWVFTDALGRPYNAKRDLKLWGEICEVADVPRKGRAPALGVTRSRSALRCC